MKVRIVLFLMCIISIITSCSQDKDKKRKDAEMIDNTSITTEESFDTFLENFSRKPTFQRQRVMFPLRVSVLAPTESGMEVVDEKITYQEWTLLDFAYDSTYATRQMDGFEQRIRVYNDSTIIEQSGVDNGIYVNYYFVKKDGKWFLESFSDVSY